MNYIIIISIFILLVITILKIEKEKENSFWLKIVILYCSMILIINFHTSSSVYGINIVIPLGIIIAFLRVANKSTKNINIKKLTLIFSLTCFILIHYIIPPLSISEMYEARELKSLLNNFETVEYVQTYSPTSEIQEKLQEYYTDRGQNMFRAFVCLEKNITIKNKDWLKRDFDTEFNIDWGSRISSEKKVKTKYGHYTTINHEFDEYIRFEETGEEYHGRFKYLDGKLYLKYVIKGKLKQNTNNWMNNPFF